MSKVLPKSTYFNFFDIVTINHTIHPPQEVATEVPDPLVLVDSTGVTLVITSGCIADLAGAIPKV